MTAARELESPGAGARRGAGLRAVLARVRPYAARVVNPLGAGIGVLLVAAALGGLYAQGRVELNDVQARLAEVRQALAAPGPAAGSLEDQRRAWESALSSALEARVEAPADSAFVQSVLDATLDSGVSLVTASAQRAQTEEIGGREYGAASYLIRVRGDMAGTQTFLRELEGNLVEALEVMSAIATTDRDGVLLSVGVVVRNELPYAGPDGQAPAGDPGKSKVAVGSAPGSRR